MTSEEARKIIKRFYRNDNPSKDDEFIFIEACSYLIESEADDEVMVSLGGYYYDKQKYDLAEKYYLMAYDHGNKWVADGLGFIYYYGRNGQVDYDKAFYYFSIAKDSGDDEAAMKIADMYRNGYGVKKDEEKYKSILLEIYERIKDTKKLFDVYPEISHRIAEIYINEGHGKDALPMLMKGKSFIAQRIRYNPFWGNFIVARRIVKMLYSIIDFPQYDFDFFDLFHLLKEPHKVNLYYNGKAYLIESFFDEGEMRIKCDDKYYKSVENFLMTALFENKHTYIIHHDDFYELELEE